MSRIKDVIEVAVHNGYASTIIEAMICQLEKDARLIQEEDTTEKQEQEANNMLSIASFLKR